ncbi:glycosyltransferase [Methylorubrum sp. Q1]|uniref:glycosyltransferase family 2 protein n=1 Tax=Methylorubrum sp. Q1 TaxID=2562453 RepID=UPI00187D0D6D|nr:glycosyltransferase [Methylorubrum sp. Q1]
MGDHSVTIAIPVHNGANYLGEAIESALCQSHPETEIIVVDDGSDDDGQTLAVARTFGSHIRTLHQSNSGVAAALNTALACASGRLFSWLSHDDVFEPGKTERQVRILDTLNRDDICLFSDLSWIDAAGRITGEQRLDPAALARNPRLAFYEGLINGCTILTARDLLLRIGGFDTRYPYTQDYRMWWRLTREAHFVHVPHCLLRSRLHPDQGSHRRDALSENSAFWSDVLDETSEVEAAMVAGSRERFLRRTGGFLRYRSPNRRVADHADRMAQASAAEASVSVVIDVGSDLEAARRTIDSVEAQTRLPDEMILVGDSSILMALGRDGACERVLRPTPEQRVPTRLRLGLTAARGAYVALLMSPDAFAPEKIARQVARMSALGCLASHSSYRSGGETVATGSFGGRVYPEIVGDCHVEISTVMIQRVLFLSGVLFMEDDAPLASNWIEVAARHEWLGLEEPLSLVETPRAPGERAPLLAWLRASAEYRRHAVQIRRLERRLAGSSTPDTRREDAGDAGVSLPVRALVGGSDAAA